MKIGVLGTGMVGQTLGSKLIERGHEVRMGSRDATNPKALAWAKSAGSRASVGTFQDAGKFGELLFNCTVGAASVDMLKGVGEQNLDAKVLIDVSNGLDFSKGMPPGLVVNPASDSIAERIQKTFPRLKVVKTLNTVTAPLMVNPSLVPGDHNLFLSGNEETAKQQVAQLLENDFGWKRRNIIDLGDLTTARAQEALILAWVRLWGKLGTPIFNWHVAQPPKAL